MLKKLLGQVVAAIVFMSAGFAFAATDVNKATAAELDAIKGIGPGISGKILDERKKGPFKDWNDLITRVNGVGETNAAKFSAEGLTVGGDSYKGAAPAAKKDDKPAAKKEDKPAAKAEEKKGDAKPAATAAATPAAAPAKEEKKDAKAEAKMKADEAKVKKEEEKKAKAEEKKKKDEEAKAKKEADKKAKADQKADKASAKADAASGAKK
jgi:competence protein ComEA